MKYLKLTVVRSACKFKIQMLVQLDFSMSRMPNSILSLLVFPIHSFTFYLASGMKQVGNYKNEEQLIKITNSDDEDVYRKEMSGVKKKEIRHFSDGGTFMIILKEKVLNDTNVLSGRVVNLITSTSDSKTKFNAQHLIDALQDRYKNMMFHNATSLQPWSGRFLLALATIFSFDVWPSDVRKAYF